MPRNGSDIYSIPPGTEGFPDTTIESEKYNTFIHDVEMDLNTPRPIVAGGTGATNANEALAALGAEKAKQVITNFDADVLVPGSFSAASSATASPVAGHAFAGIVYQASTGNMVIEARDLSTGIIYARFQTGGVWNAWVVDNSSQYVLKSGDTMSGPLILSQDPSVALGAASKQYADSKVAKTGDTMTGPLTLAPNCHWNFGAPAGSGSYYSTISTPDRFFLGSDSATDAFRLYCTGISGNAITVDGPTGKMSVALDPTAALGVATKQYADAVANAKVAKAGDTMTGNLTINKGVAGGIGPKLEFYNSGGSLADAAVIDFYDVSIRSRLQFSVDRSPYGADLVFLSGDGTPVEKFRVQTDGQVLVTADPIGALNVATKQYVDGKVAKTGDTMSGTLTATAFILASPGLMTINGDAISSNLFFQNSSASLFAYTNASGNLVWYANGAPQAYFWYGGPTSFQVIANASKPGGGAWQDSSDIRIKNVEGEYKRGLDDIAQLRPIHYTFKGNDTPEAPQHAKITTKDGKFIEDPTKVGDPLVAPYPNSPHKDAAEKQTRYVGLIAQEVENILPEMVTRRSAYINGEAVTDLLDLDTTSLIFALVNAVKELKARVEQLEAA